MCFIIHPDHPDKKIAKRDIACYKFFKNRSGELFSTPRRFKYELHKLYKTKIIVKLQCWKIEHGFHSHSNKKCFLEYINSGNERVKCIIPKGSEYYYNPFYKEYVSNQIIIKEISRDHQQNLLRFLGI
jgi:hypothetical protein